MTKAVGRLIEDFIVIENVDAANRIYNKGYYGEPQSGGILKLTLIEGLFLFENEKLDIYKESEKLTYDSLLQYCTSRIPKFEIKYIVYTDLKKRGHVVQNTKYEIRNTKYEIRDTNYDLKILEKNKNPRKAEVAFFIKVLSERDIFDFNSIIDLLNSIKTMKSTDKPLILGIVDEESEITYYRVRSLKFKVQSLEFMDDARGTRHEALCLDDRVIILEKSAGEQLHQDGFYGNIIGDRLQISLIEGAYLADKKIITLRDAKSGNELSLTEFIELSKRIEPDFELRLKVYQALKSKNLIVKTGFKFGAHFRAYDENPAHSHARYLVNCVVPEQSRISWPDISKSVRLAHGVKKELVFALVPEREPEKIEYISFERVRP